MTPRYDKTRLYTQPTHLVSAADPLRGRVGNDTERRGSQMRSVVSWQRGADPPEQAATVMTRVSTQPSPGHTERPRLIEKQSTSGEDTIGVRDGD